MAHLIDKEASSSTSGKSDLSCPDSAVQFEFIPSLQEATAMLWTNIADFEKFSRTSEDWSKKLSLSLCGDSSKERNKDHS